jgi:hypothetical protein
MTDDIVAIQQLLYRYCTAVDRHVLATTRSTKIAPKRDQ